jgi:hypothetical protein
MMGLAALLLGARVAALLLGARCNEAVWAEFPTVGPGAGGLAGALRASQKRCLIGANHKIIS